MKNLPVKSSASLALAFLVLGCGKQGSHEGEIGPSESQAAIAAQADPIEEKVEMPSQVEEVFARENLDATRAQRAAVQARGINVDVRPGITAEARAILAKTPLDQSIVYEAFVADACNCKTRTCYGDVAHAYNKLIFATPRLPEMDDKSSDSRRKARACHDALPVESIPNSR